MRIKICGVTSPEAVEAAAEAGADAIGFVFADSPRRMDPAAAERLARSAPPFLSRVAVFLHPAPDEVARVLDRFRPDWVQSDAEDRGTFLLPPGVGFLPVFRDGPRAPGEVERYLARFRAERPAILFEAARSGCAMTADWGLARRLASRSSLVLAGGLDPGNVRRAVRDVRPFAVDVSTGVERRPGEKDRDRIEAFVAAVRNAEASIRESGDAK